MPEARRHDAARTVSTRLPERPLFVGKPPPAGRSEGIRERPKDYERTKRLRRDGDRPSSYGSARTATDDLKTVDQWWVKLGKLQHEVRAAVQQGDDKRKDQAFDEMLYLSTQGAEQAEQWQELLQLTKDLARLKETQAKIVRDQKAFLPMADAMQIIETLATAVRDALLLVRDQWRQVAAMLTPDELDELIIRMRDATVAGGDEAWEGSFVRGIDSFRRKT